MKDEVIRIRLTKEELRCAEEVSIELFGHINRSKLMRKLLRDFVGMGPDLIDKELKEFREAVRQATGICRNFNQITARINSDVNEISHLTPEYLERLMGQVNVINGALKTYISNTLTRYQGIVKNDKD